MYSLQLQKQTHIVGVYFVGVEGKLHCWAYSPLLSPLLLYLSQTSSDRLIQIVT